MQSESGRPVPVSGWGLGPVVGGLLLGVFGWSSIFWVNVPFAVGGIALTVTAVPESRNPDTRPVDIPGVLTSAGALLALTFGLVQSSANSWASAPVWASLAAGVVLLSAFVVWEHRAPFPMIPSQMVKLRSFATSCGVYLFSYVALTGVLFYLTLLYQDVDRWSALHTGLSWLCLNVPFLLMAQFAGRLSRRLSATMIVGGGCLGSAAGIITLSRLTPASSFVIAVIGYALLGAGNGALIPGITNVAMRDVPPGLSGTASGVLNASRQVGTSVGLAILGAVGAHAAASAWTSEVAQLPAAARRAALSQARNVASGRISSVTRALGAGHGAAAEHAFSHGYEVAVLIAGFCLIAAAVIAAVGLRDDRRRQLDAARCGPASPSNPDARSMAAPKSIPNGAHAKSRRVTAEVR